MKNDSAGPSGNRRAGLVYPVSPEEGQALVAGGFAEWVEAPKKEVSTAEKPRGENAALRTSPPKPRR
jgi:hypothetical protein